MTDSYLVKKSARKTLGLEVTRDGTVIVRAPYASSAQQIRQFVGRHRDWIARQLAKCPPPVPRLTSEEIGELMRRAKAMIPEKVAYFAPLVGVEHAGITVRLQKTRWGSCSAKGTLSFNCLLMLAPEEVLDSVVVHELCHRLEMNHSERFYREVLRVFPDYYRCHGWLKEHGAELLMRAGK